MFYCVVFCTGLEGLAVCDSIKNESMNICPKIKNILSPDLSSFRHITGTTFWHYLFTMTREIINGSWGY
jgi:hypothetical protein